MINTNIMNRVKEKLSSVSFEEYEKNSELYDQKLYNDDGTLNPKAANNYF